MRASLLFPTVHVANSLEEAERHPSEEPIDIVFIAIREDGDVVNRFIKRLKQELAGATRRTCSCSRAAETRSR